MSNLEKQLDYLFRKCLIRLLYSKVVIISMEVIDCFGYIKWIQLHSRYEASFQTYCCNADHIQGKSMDKVLCIKHHKLADYNENIFMIVWCKRNWRKRKLYLIEFDFFFTFLLLYWNMLFINNNDIKNEFKLIVKWKIAKFWLLVYERYWSIAQIWHREIDLIGFQQPFHEVLHW